MSIHPTAIVEEGAQLGAGCVIQAGAIIRRYSVLGDGVVVHPYAVVGGDPQFLKFDPATVSHVHVGAGTVIREHATLNRSIHAGKATTIGARCFLMANAHVGHDCVVADDVVLANNVMLAGHVEVGPFTFVGGGAAIHQFVRVGEGVMIGGLTRLTRDVAPFLMVAERDEVPGFNVVGLKRRGFSRAAIRELKASFAHVFAGGDPRKRAAARVAEGVQSAEARKFLEFFAGGKRGFVRPNLSVADPENDVG
ncbi:acyl-ACP--UDP-N-acetylglucosamine O-acyltransferase [Oleiharenicola lentus]|uniref:acyl-ACP--UDP-N-acetylglucosamine O-acyltransferase n=1 Tax=Oleiharenicola lentus TaxID=2508720 RepID=UPI003F66FB7C